MSDIIERIKGLRYVHVPQASQLFEEAIAEIERLRITDEEREAIQWAVRQADRMEMYLERQIEPDKENPHITAGIAAHAARRKVLEEMLSRRV